MIQHKSTLFMKILGNKNNKFKTFFKNVEAIQHLSTANMYKLYNTNNEMLNKSKHEKMHYISSIYKYIFHKI